MTKYLFLTVLAFISLLYFPRIAAFGLFTDGLIYGTIAHNLAEGIGELWAPIYHNGHYIKENVGIVFYEHMPLMFWMESVFFRLFGDGFYVEKLYGTLILSLHIGLLTVFFRKLTKGRYEIYQVWPVLLLWYSVSSILWGFPQNMIDNTLSLWALASVMAAYWSMEHRSIIWAVASGLLLGGAFLTKGPIGLFPLAVLPLYFLVFGRGLRPWVGVIFGFGLVIMGLYFWPPANAFVSQFLHQQVMASLSGERTTGGLLGGHLSILVDMVVEFIPLYGTAIVLAIFQRKQKEKSPYRKAAFWLVLVGLSATLPLAISAKTHSFYLISGVPYFALAIGLYWVETIRHWTNSVLTLRTKRIWAGLIILIFGWTVIATVLDWGSYKRDSSCLIDMEALMHHIDEGATLGFRMDMSYEIDIHTYIERHHQVKTVSEWEPTRQVILPKNAAITYQDQIRALGFTKKETDMTALELWVK